MNDAENGCRQPGLTEAQIKRASARGFMQEAKTLLADAGAASANMYLNCAIACIDLTQEVGFDNDAALPIATSDLALVRATGGALAILGTILARNSLVSLDEFGQFFEGFANASANGDPAMGRIIAEWGGAIFQAAHAVERPDPG